MRSAIFDSYHSQLLMFEIEHTSTATFVEFSFQKISCDIDLVLHCSSKKGLDIRDWPGEFAWPVWLLNGTNDIERQ